MSDRKSYLKEATIEIQSLDDTLVLRQLNARAQVEVLAHYKDETTRHLAAATSVRFGVPAWSDLSNDEVLDMLTMEQIAEINDAIASIGADDPKSRPTPSVRSISA